MRKIPVYQPLLGNEEKENVMDCLSSGWISSLGKYLELFEQGFSQYCGKKYGISTSNGTTALHVALRALGVSATDEVIVPTLSFIATANSVLYANAKPVFVDSERETWNLDPSLIEKCITKKTKAIVAVHLYGHPANMQELRRIANRHKLYLVEDAAEAHGAICNGKRVGSFGDISCFSFYGNKVITTGEGGMCLTDDLKLAEKMKLLRDHGMSKTRRYWHPELGYNYRMTNIQAALGVAQLSRIDRILAMKNRIAQWYNQNLEGIEGIELPPQASWATNVYWLYSILIKKDFGLSRDKLMEKLKSKGIDSRPFFIPNHQMPYFHENTKKAFPVAKMLSDQGVNLPSFPELQEKQVKYISRCIQECFRQRKDF